MVRTGATMSAAMSATAPTHHHGLREQTAAESNHSKAPDGRPQAPDSGDVPPVPDAPGPAGYDEAVAWYAEASGLPLGEARQRMDASMDRAIEVAARAWAEKNPPLTLGRGALMWPGVTQQEVERSTFARAVVMVALGADFTQPTDKPDALEAALVDPSRRALLAALQQGDLDGVAAWCRAHGLVDDWLPPILAALGGRPSLQPNHPAAGGGAVLMGTGGEVVRVPLPPPRAPLPPPLPTIETRAAYVARAQKEWEEAVAAHKALGWADAEPKRGPYKIKTSHTEDADAGQQPTGVLTPERDFHMLAERVVLGKSWQALARRYCGGPEYITKARNAVRKTAERMGLKLPTH